MSDCCNSQQKKNGRKISNHSLLTVKLGNIFLSSYWVLAFKLHWNSTFPFAYDVKI